MRQTSCAEPAAGVRVARVRRGSAAADGGLAAGDRLLTINGTVLRDAIDFQFNAADDVLDVELERGGGVTRLSLARRPGHDLGVELEPPRAAEISTCANKCVFCFIHQLPKGMRRSLYVKDDDFRLSFLHGNYITLTDLEEPELARIVEQRLSPLYVSVHATDPELRHALLGRPRVQRPILPVMERLARAGITMHAQIVLCPELNDGAPLARTVSDLSRLHPMVTTTAIVPVGLTRHRERLPALRALTSAEAAALVDVVEAWQGDFLRDLGSRFVFPADEIYLLAGRALPAARAYEGFPVMEDGIGLVRRFEDGFARAARRLASHAPCGTAPAATVVTGEMFAPRLAALLAGVADTGVHAEVLAVPNEFFGRQIAVAGLLTGGDILRAVSRQPRRDVVLIPSVTVRDADGVFLDDVTPADLARDLGTPVRVIDPTPRALLRALTGRA